MRFFLLLFLFSAFQLTAQDAYHAQLLEELSTEYSLPSGEFIFFDSEATTNNVLFHYGCTKAIVPVEDMPFSQAVELDVAVAGNNVWENAAGLNNQTVINQGDRLLLVVWVRNLEAVFAQGTGLLIFEENEDPYDKDFIYQPPLRSEWLRFLIPFEAQRSYAPNEGKFTFHIGQMEQKIQVAGLAAINYGQSVALEDLPQQLHNDSYEGQEPNASWRTAAAERIDIYRKANLKIEVTNTDGQPIPAFPVRVNMLQHDFPFGTAVVGCRFQGNNCENEMYQEKILDVDGQGHGFNWVVFENALKWDGWEEQWIGSPEQAASAAAWLTEHGIHLRGHTLLWPGCNHVPTDICDNLEDVTYVKNRHQQHMQDLMTYPGLGDWIEDWDVVNEITTVRDLEYAFQASAEYDTGREYYVEAFETAQDIAPEVGRYINDYVTLAGGGFNRELIDRYQGFIQELLDANAPVSGIGFQSHLRGYPIAPEFLYDLFDDYYQQFGLPFKVTEFDVVDMDEELAGQYMADYLTVLFSHPAADGFMMWGFWDGSHWLSNAPIFNMDWSLKPSGEAFVEKVYQDWWTPETDLLTDNNGDASIRGFKGKYELIYECNGEEVRQEINLKEDMVIQIQDCQLTTSTVEVEEEIRIFPNPSSGWLRIEGLNFTKVNKIVLYTLSGQQVMVLPVQREIQLPSISAGSYFMKIEEAEKTSWKMLNLK